jgi:hypothetical protein
MVDSGVAAALAAGACASIAGGTLAVAVNVAADAEAGRLLPIGEALGGGGDDWPQAQQATATSRRKPQEHRTIIAPHQMACDASSSCLERTTKVK